MVDDEFSIVESLVEILGWEGFVTATAADGRQGLEEFERFGPDVILVDFMMPVMNGPDMIEELRKRPNGRTVPVILMTAAPLQLTSEPKNWDALLRKPFELPALLRMLMRVLTSD